MRKYTLRTGLVSTAVVFAIVGNAAVFALPVKTPIRSPEPVATVPPTDGSGGSAGGGSASISPVPAGPSVKPQPLTSAQKQTCQNRADAINAIMSRIDTRTQNQITLFSTIATRVESFYTSKSKPVSNYDQLVAAIAAAKTQTQTDLSSMQANGTIVCSGTNPKGTVTAFQGYLKTELTDMKAYRTAVRNLITAVASANGVTVSGSSQANQGGQQ